MKKKKKEKGNLSFSRSRNLSSARNPGKKSNPYLRLVETPRHTVSLNSVQIPAGTDIVRYTVHEPLHSSTCPPDVNYLPTIPIRQTKRSSFLRTRESPFIFPYTHIYIFWTAQQEGEGRDRDTFLHSRKWWKLAVLALWYPTLRTLGGEFIPGTKA